MPQKDVRFFLYYAFYLCPIFGPNPKSNILLNLASNYTRVFTLFLTSVQDSNLTWDESGRNISHCPKMKMNDKKVTIPFPLPRLLTPCSMIKRWKKICLLGLIPDPDGQDQKVGYRINYIFSEVLVSWFFSFFKHCTEHWTRYSRTKNC